MADTQFGLKFRTSKSIDDIEDWLSTHCDGDWDVVLGGLVEKPDGSLAKEIQVFFEHEQGRETFKSGFRA